MHNYATQNGRVSQKISPTVTFETFLRRRSFEKKTAKNYTEIEEKSNDLAAFLCIRCVSDVRWAGA